MGKKKKQEAEEEAPPVKEQARTFLANRELTLEILRVVRNCRRLDGGEISNMGIAFRVPGATPAMVREVRDRLAAEGVLAEEIGPVEEGEGK